jgi:hypothetical protein
MGRKATAQGPKVVGYFWPVVEALKRLGGSARQAEVRDSDGVLPCDSRRKT